jgi:glutamate-ammonia-ligase adenylyltransferase
MKVALGDNPDPAGEPKAFQALLARAGRAKTFKGLRTRLEQAQAAARAAYAALVQG